MKRWMRIVLLAVCGAAVLAGAGVLGRYLWQSRQQEEQFDQLAQMVEQATPTAPTEPEATEEATQESTEPASEWVEVTDPDTGETVLVLPEYAELYLLNNDMVGWIAIEGTEINYPVMQKREIKDYYLYRDFYEQESVHGCIYVREQCDVTAPSDNLVIYGHRMKDGSMFRSLLEYEDEAYWQAHPYITFNTLTERHTYQVMAVFKTAATNRGFPYHRFVDATEEAEFDEYVAACRELALYDTGVSAQYGDKLITLATCEYSRESGRMVIVAKRID